jgi:hypothetical protein
VDEQELQTIPRHDITGKEYIKKGDEKPLLLIPAPLAPQEESPGSFITRRSTSEAATSRSQAMKMRCSPAPKPTPK